MRGDVLHLSHDNTCVLGGVKIDMYSYLRIFPWSHRDANTIELNDIMVVGQH